MLNIKPVLYEVSPFDSTIGSFVYFKYTGGKRVVGNLLEITDTSTNLIVFSNETIKFDKSQEIPPRWLENGKTYTARLKVKLSSGEYSPFSEPITFICFAKPTLRFISFDDYDYVYNQDVTIEVQYEQNNGERVKRYRYKLYDEDLNLVSNYPLRTPTYENYFSETLIGLDKNKVYIIECKVETVNGMVYKNTASFTPIFLKPSVAGEITATNNEEEGTIEVNTTVREFFSNDVVTERLTSEYDFDSGWVTVPSDKPLKYKNLAMNKTSDFVMKIWCKDIPNNTKFINMKSKDEDSTVIEFWKYADKVVAVKVGHGVSNRYESNTLNITGNRGFMLYAKVISSSGIDLKIRTI